MTGAFSAVIGGGKGVKKKFKFARFRGRRAIIFSSADFAGRFKTGVSGKSTLADGKLTPFNIRAQRPQGEIEKMKIRSMFSRAACALAVLALAMPFSGAARALDEITVAYFLQWPTANQVAQLDKTYDEALGVKVNWRAFGNGNEMTAAMAGGDVHIAYSQGFVPFVVGVTRGLPLKLVGVAVTYAENDNCIVHPKAGVTKDNAKELEGKTVMTPIGNVTHYKLLRTLGHLGVDADKVKIVPADSGNDVAAAFSRGDIDMGCAFGGPLNAMQAEGGKPLMTGAEQEAVGIQTFDIVSTTEKFAQENPDLLVKFLQVTEDANNAYKIYPAKHYEAIAKAAEDSVENTVGFLKKFGFPSAEEQLNDLWMGGGVQKIAKGVADLLVEKGQMDEALGDYDHTVDDSFLRKVR